MMPRGAGLLLLLVLFAGLRLALPRADPPHRYPSGKQAEELLVEGPAKASEARRFGIFGTLATQAADQYHIWSTQSPVYVRPLGWFFRAFGASYVTLRVYCALAAALGLLALWRLGREHGEPRIAPVAAAIVALSFHDVVLTRGGLLEPYLDALLAATFLAAVLALRSLPWLVVAELGFAAALLVKQTAVLVFPALLALGIWALVKARERGARPWQLALPVLAGVALAAALLGYVRSEAYWETVRWNFGHMVVGVEAHSDPGVGALRPAALLERLVDGRRWRGFLFVIPLLPLALARLVDVTVGLARRREVDAVDVAAAAWLLCALAGLQLTEHVRPRFSIVMLPPAALLAASFLVETARQAGRPSWRWAFPALAAVTVLATDVRWILRWWSTATYDLDRAGAELARHLDGSSVLVGPWATPIAFDTRADVLYVKGPFNTDPERVRALGFTHFLGTDRQHPPAGAPPATEEPITRVTVLGREYRLLELGPAGAPPSALR